MVSVLHPTALGHVAVAPAVWAGAVRVFKVPEPQRAQVLVKPGVKGVAVVYRIEAGLKGAAQLIVGWFQILIVRKFCKLSKPQDRLFEDIV